MVYLIIISIEYDTKCEGCMKSLGARAVYDFKEYVTRFMFDRSIFDIAI